MSSPHDQQDLHDELQNAYARLDTVTDTARTLFEALTELCVTLYFEDAAGDAAEKTRATADRQHAVQQARTALNTADAVLGLYAEVGGDDA